MPIGEFNDLVACYAIERGAEQKKAVRWGGGQPLADDAIPDLE